MFGSRAASDFDGEALADRAKTIETREDFVRFAELLAQNFRKRRKEWENDRLDRYLDGLLAFSTDLEGYIHNTGDDPKSNPWRLLATILLGAKVYE